MEHPAWQDDMDFGGELAQLDRIFAQIREALAELAAAAAETYQASYSQPSPVDGATTPS